MEGIFKKQEEISDSTDSEYRKRLNWMKQFYENNFDNENENFSQISDQNYPEDGFLKSN